ncbi:MAG: hypothetical protein A2W00_03720 [Candidatus Eisenbacteria bacterium RBG_16_71_46]|nr:MAG: hypothetical protein A2W00_03720 [Candidatus Eisenbacteria bacterium RBG_16_71_46]
MMNTALLPRRAATLATALLVLVAVSGVAAADTVTLTAMRSWSAPANTRVVLDFTAPVNPVTPDSGVTRQLVLSIPGETVVRAAGVPAVMAVGDSVVDSVVVTRVDGGARFQLFLADSISFRVFRLMAEDDKPFRLVIDVARPGAEAAEDQRLEGIAAVKRRERMRIVVVDPGHGGEDSGARGPGGVLEKNVTLAVGRMLVDELNGIPGVKAVLTRDRDYFIPLRDRYRLAEKMRADVFISIHANSSRRRGSGSGSEVYFLSLRGASDQADADLADLENAADLVGGVPAQSEDDLVSILYDVKRSSALKQSELLAESLLDQVARDRRLESRGVKQAGFVVLKSVEFPSVLVELAFINNPVEARLLRSPAFQRQMSGQLATGVKYYFQRAGIGLLDGGGRTGQALGR